MFNYIKKEVDHGLSFTALKEEVFACQLLCYVIMVTFLVAVRRATQKKISYAEIETKLSTVSTKA